MISQEGLFRVVFRFSKRLAVRGFDARVLLPEPGQPRIIESKLSAALAYLQQYSAYRRTRLHELLPRILISPIGSPAAYCFARSGMCALKDEYVLSTATSFADLALTLVHEGTHARLLAARVPYRNATRARVERLCVRAELIVARRMPGSSALVQRRLETLAQPDSYFSAEAHRRRERELLRTLGVTERLAALIARCLALLSRRRADDAT